MRLKEYITETISFKDQNLTDAAKMMLHKDCKQYLDDIYKAGNNNVLFRGFSKIRGDMFIRKPRKDRRPTDSDQEWHDLLDRASKQKFGVKMRSEGLFCKLKTPTGYGIDYIPIPSGKYICIYSPMVSDAYFYDREEPDMDEREKSAFDIMKSYKKGSVINAIRDLPDKMNEIALICDRYYAIHVKYYNQLLDWNRNIHEI